MNVRKSILGVAAGIAAVAAGAGALVGVGTSGLATGAAVTDLGSSVLPCTSNQYSVRLVPGDSGMSNRHAALEITAKQGERCKLDGAPVTNLVGAHDVLLSSTAPADAPDVVLSSGSSAHIPLHWTLQEPEATQQTPLAFTFDAPSASNPHGDPIDPTSEVTWDLGAVDAGAEQHVIEVGQVVAGAAPSV